MTNEQKIEAIKELAKSLTATELHEVVDALLSDPEDESTDQE